MSIGTMAEKFKSTLALLAISYFILNVDATLKTASIQQVFPNDTRVRILSHSTANSSIAYLICNPNCSVVLQTLNPDGTKTEASCSFEPVSIKKVYFDIELQIIPVDKDRVIIGYIKRFENPNDSEYVFANIRLSDCKITEATISLSNFEPNTVRETRSYRRMKKFALIKNSNNTYTVVFRYEDQFFNKMNLNADGDVVSGPTLWDFRGYYMPNEFFSISTNSSSDNYGLIYVDNFEGTYVHFYIKESFDFDFSKAREVIEVHGGHYLGHSVAHGLFSACFYFHHIRVECSQYDLAGNMKFRESNLPSAIFAQPYNLPNGGLLLFTIKCNGDAFIRPKIRFCVYEGDESYRVTKLDAQGKFAGSLEIQGFTCKMTTDTEQFLKPRFYKNEVGEYCLLLACTNVGMRKYLKLAINCFSDEDLKM